LYVCPALITRAPGRAQRLQGSIMAGKKKRSSSNRSRGQAANNNSGRSNSSERWLKEHFDDPFVKQARREGYRARSCYKLQEINDKHELIRPGMTVLDLGAAPGGWSQVALKLVGARGRVIASDILPMEPLEGVTFIQGDFTEPDIFNSILAVLDGTRANVVVSDMAPNMSGITAMDQPRAMALCELAAYMASKILYAGGGFVCKTFQGEGCDALIKQLRQEYRSVKISKPKASRDRSREMYLVARGRRASGGSDDAETDPIADDG
jgi:23S rRNA (uridine2552-2'-O)-methyltransferase